MMYAATLAMKGALDMTDNPLTSWTDAPATDRGIRFWRGTGWEWWAYSDLACYVRRIANGLALAGVRCDDRVLVVERTGPDFVAALVGVMLSGAIPCPIAPPHLFQHETLYGRHLRAVSEVARPSMVITSADLVERLAQDDDPTPLRTATELAANGEGGPRPPASAALLQFTSGSSGRVKGVRVPVAALNANVVAIQDWLEMGEGDATASWLPVHHDMGLTGCLLSPLAQQRDLWLQEPADFVRDPSRYVACFNTRGAVMTAMPPFGLDYIARRVRPESLEGYDFSDWRACIVGAERIDIDVVDRFMSLMGPFGFQRRALLPAYGLAEATLAVTGLALREELVTTPVAAPLVSLGEPVASTGPGIRQLVGCGRALGGVRVTVVDEAGAPLPDRHVGQIVVGGTSVAEGYVRSENTASLTEWRDGALWTGDAGFLDDGQLYVIGRLGDAMKVRGRTVFAEDIESAVVEAGVPRLRVAVLLGSGGSGATGVILLERPEDGWIGPATAALRRLAEGMSMVVLDVPRRAIARTTSGKPKRREMWAAYVAGTLDGTEILPAPVGTVGD